MVKRRFHFTIDINADEYLKYYSGRASSVRAQTHEGPIIEFPAINLTPWVKRSGISGTFMIEYDEKNKLKNIQKLE